MRQINFCRDVPEPAASALASGTSLHFFPETSFANTLLGLSQSFDDEVILN
ncbi:hypothetical protein [Mastigocoleus sp. MO_188.B34]|uniref:hypothetical protein n=1 Tax=Mastigocoleus sp. MO_188.B34 TaxID=3036635 RepID=UPI002629BD72|nr:hypothetical protein [Mastigocoleus sp. MO_188.B34]